jgi:hypothetical protein
MAYRSGPPHDPWNGLRVGGIVGVIVGAVLTALMSFGGIWLMLAGGVVGGIIGYRRERARIARPPG